MFLISDSRQNWPIRINVVFVLDIEISPKFIVLYLKRAALIKQLYKIGILFTDIAMAKCIKLLVNRGVEFSEL